MVVKTSNKKLDDAIFVYLRVFTKIPPDTSKVDLGLRLLVHPPIFYSLNVSYDMCASYVRVLKKSLLRIYSFFFHKVDPLKMLKTWFRDNGQSLGHTFSKAIEIPRSSKIEGRENNFSDTFSASDRDFFFLKDLKRTILGHFFFS